MKKGFTLVEVLVSIILLTLLLSTAMFSFRFFINTVDKLTPSLPKDTMSYTYLNNSLSGIYFYPINTIIDFKKTKIYFFKHTSTSCTYITTTPVYYDTISVAKIEYKNHKLYYYESKLYTKEQDFKNPKILEDSFSFVLKKDVKDFSIKYVFYHETQIPKQIYLNIDTTKWLFAIESNNIKYKSKIKKEEF